MLIKRILIFFSLCLFIMSIITNFQICEFVTGEILYVGGSGEGNYSVIQDAINISTDGDIIFVYNGIYYENIEANKSISLIGENKDTTIIIGKNSFNVITINAPWLNLTGFTIQQGLVSGIWIECPGNCNIYQNNINYNTIGIYIISSRNTKIYNNTISNNSVIGINITSTQIPSNIPGNNIIFHNNFIDNKHNVYDEGTSNNWSYQKEGNYYDDYFGSDKNNDCIGDISYDIAGGKNKDYFPLMMPYDGTIRLKEFFVDYESIYKMLIIGIIVAILFLLPIAYIWYRKTRYLR